MTENRPIIKCINDFTEEEYSAFQDSQDVPLTLLESISELYFRPRDFERDGRFYEMLAIPQYRKMVMKLLGRIVMKFDSPPPNKYFIGENRSISNLLQFEKITRRSEIYHLMFVISFLAVSVLGIYSAINFDLNNPETKKMLVGSGLWDLFCIKDFFSLMLQRYTRAKIYNTLDLKEEKILAKK